MQILDEPGCQGERTQLGEVSTGKIHGDSILAFDVSRHSIRPAMSVTWDGSTPESGTNGAVDLARLEPKRPILSIGGQGQ